MELEQILLTFDRRLEELHREDVARNVRLTNEIIMLGAECARLRVDAERYAWLREYSRLAPIWIKSKNFAGGASLDAAIDAATAPMRAEKEDGRG